MDTDFIKCVKKKWRNIFLRNLNSPEVTPKLAAIVCFFHIGANPVTSFSSWRFFCTSTRFWWQNHGIKPLCLTLSNQWLWPKKSPQKRLVHIGAIFNMQTCFTKSALHFAVWFSAASHWHVDKRKACELRKSYTGVGTQWTISGVFLIPWVCLRWFVVFSLNWVNHYLGMTFFLIFSRCLKQIRFFSYVFVEHSDDHEISWTVMGWEPCYVTLAGLTTKRDSFCLNALR